jgi:hypothetical protein
VFAQQWQLLRLSGGLNPNPRQETIDDLTADVQRHQTNQETVVIVGNFNEQLGDDPNLMPPHVHNLISLRHSTITMATRPWFLRIYEAPIDLVMSSCSKNYSHSCSLAASTCSMNACTQITEPPSSTLISGLFLETVRPNLLNQPTLCH